MTREEVLEKLKSVIDPELGLNVVDLGLVYDVRIDGGTVSVDLTMTTPACPLGEQICDDARAQLLTLSGVERADVNLVWEPAWSPERLTPEARLALGW